MRRIFVCAITGPAIEETKTPKAEVSHWRRVKGDRFLMTPRISYYLDDKVAYSSLLTNEKLQRHSLVVL